LGTSDVRLGNAKADVLRAKLRGDIAAVRAAQVAPNLDSYLAALFDSELRQWEMVRARSLVARAVQVVVDEGVRRARADVLFAPVTNASIKADLTRIFQKDGVLGLIHLTLPTDRRRYHIAPPPWTNARALALLERQDPYLFEPAAG
jgi:hypothetical protein